MKTHRFTVRGDLLSINRERSLHKMARAETVKVWRIAGRFEAQAARIPRLGAVSIIAKPFQHKSVLGDAGNHLPSIKAIVDGLVDAGVLEGDGPEYVRSLTLMAPQRTQSCASDYVTLELVEAVS